MELVKNLTIVCYAQFCDIHNKIQHFFELQKILRFLVIIDREKKPIDKINKYRVSIPSVRLLVSRTASKHMPDCATMDISILYANKKEKIIGLIDI